LINLNYGATIAMVTAISAAISFFGCFAVISLLYRSSLKTLLLDTPTHRSLHSKPIAKIGGIGVVVGVVLAIGALELFSPVFVRTELISVGLGTLLALLSIANDKIDISPLNRLVLQIAICLIWALSTKAYSVGSVYDLIIILLVVLTLGWSLNLYNFMDGSDGLCGAMTVIGFGAYAIAAFNANSLSIGLMSLSVCAAAAAFICWNFPPAKIFLGDGGSVPLGFLAAALGISGVYQGVWGPAFPFAVFAMFWADATYTLFKRILKKEQFWKPHNTHWYQKAIRSGNSHKKIVLIHLFCNSLLAVTAIAIETVTFINNLYLQSFIIGFALTVVALFGFWAEREFANSLKLVSPSSASR
jgi:UDP-N-acetylmuramyl pentapeptide phosphotransferase/UDP-N-acetylglucosamine-1-phosphate transferase